MNQSRIEQHVLDRLLGDWLLESALLGMLPAAMASDVLDAAARFGTGGVAMRIPHSWEWDKRPHVDPGKEATAQRTRLQSGTTSRAHEMKESGLNMDEIDAQAAASFGYVGEDGLPDVESYRKVLGASLFSNGNAVVAEEQDTEEPEADNDGQSETEQTEPTDDQV